MSDLPALRTSIPAHSLHTRRHYLLHVAQGEEYRVGEKGSMELGDRGTEKRTGERMEERTEVRTEARAEARAEVRVVEKMLARLE